MEFFLLQIKLLGHFLPLVVTRDLSLVSEPREIEQQLRMSQRGDPNISLEILGWGREWGLAKNGKEKERNYESLKRDNYTPHGPLGSFPKKKMCLIFQQVEISRN